MPAWHKLISVREKPLAIISGGAEVGERQGTSLRL